MTHRTTPRFAALGLAVAATLTLAASAQAAFIVGFDINAGTDPLDQEAGYEPMNGAGTATQNGITLSLSGGNGDRDRGTGGNVALSPVPDVTRDFRFPWAAKI
jgi:hypothetical protein